MAVQISATKKCGLDAQPPSSFAEDRDLRSTSVPCPTSAPRAHNCTLGKGCDALSDIASDRNPSALGYRRIIFSLHEESAQLLPYVIKRRLQLLNKLPLFNSYFKMQQAQKMETDRSSLLHPTRHSGVEGPGSIDCQGPTIYRSKSTVRVLFPLESNPPTLSSIFSMVLKLIHI